MNYATALTLATLGGLVLPLQVLINARLSQGLNHPLWAVTVSFVVGTLGLLAWIALSSRDAANWANAASLPWWAWVGGLLGAAYVTFTIVTVPVLGATALVLLIILGQMVSGTLLDHFGILTEQKPITLIKLAGLALVFIGTWLVVRQ